MAFTPKSWANTPSTSTPISAAALGDTENRLSAYTDTSIVAVSQSAGVNQSGLTVKGATNIATSESRTNVAYGTLTTPDQVTGIVLPTNGLIRVWYQALWQNTVAGAARAAIFIGSNQLKVQTIVAATPATQAAAIDAISVVNNDQVLATTPAGLASMTQGPYGTDVTTGQAVGFAIDGTANIMVQELAGAVVNASTTGTNQMVGGPCTIFAAAGTYTISVQYKATSGSVTASGRKLWVQALSFA